MHQTFLAALGRTAVAMAVAVAVAPAAAQNTTAGVAGRVTDGSGAPVAGASVTIVHRESGSTSSATTDAAGRYVARGLRVGGPYTIRVGQGGRTESRDDVFLGLAETTSVDVQLGVSAQTITVTGRAASGIDRNAMGAGTTIGSRELAAQPSLRRNLQDYARLDPRLAQTDKERGEISAAGQNTRFNSITIDGVTTNDTFGIEANNLPTLKQPISIDAIQSVQVNVSNYDVTQKGYTGANVNAVTKSGTNEIKGSVSYVYRDEGLAGERFNRSTGTYFDPADFKETTSGFTLGGPILKDQLFFFVSAEKFKSTRTRPDFSPLGGQGTNVGITPTAISSAIDVATNTWGMDIGTIEVPGGVAVDVKDTLLRLDWNISDNHRATLRYNKTEQTEPVLTGFSATGLSMSSYWFQEAKTFDGLVGQWFADWSSTFSTEVKLSKRNYHAEPTAINGTRLPQITLRFAGALPPGTPSGVNSGNRDLQFGTERSRHFNELDTETIDAYVGANWSLGAHELKFGIDGAKNDIYDPFVQDANGQYRFQCENSSATFTYSFGAINCATATAAQVEQAVLENFRLGRPSFYQVQQPRAGFTLADAAATWSYRNTGLFLQDTWKFNDKLNLLFGVRVDQQDVPSKPPANAAAAAPLVPGSINGTTVVRNSGGFGLDNTTTLDGNTLVQPRFGFNWDLGNAERRVQLRGGIGLFQGAAANVWLTNPFSNPGVVTAVLSCTTATTCQTAGATFSPDPGAQPGLTGTPPAPNVDFLSKDLEQPSVWKANLAFESELPIPGWATLTAGIEWLHTETKSGVTYEHLNLGGPTRTGPDGREMFYTPQGYNGACWNANGSTITTGACAGFRNRALSNPNFSNVYLARKTDKGTGDAVTFSLQQPLTAGFGWGVAYTHTRAKEVSPLTSSTSGSNWGNRNVFNPNEDVLQNSNYLVKDRIGGNLTFSRAFVGNYRTTIGIVYEGRRGKPYGWTYINDLNGDGLSGNDLMYIPSAPGSGEVVFRGGAAEEARFWEIVDANPGLSSARGGVVGRNNSFAPWVNSFDLRISQELPALSAKHRASLTFDILNFGNLIKKRWGRIDEIGFPSNRSFVNYNGLDASGRYIYSLGSLEDYVTRQAAGESQWAAQVTLRYEF